MTEPTADELFFTRAGLDEKRVGSIVGEALHGADDGELYLEYTQSESFSFDDGRLKSASFDTSQGFGMRSVAGESTGYAHASELSEAAIRRAGDTVRAVQAGRSGVAAEGPARTNRSLYRPDNPLSEIGFEAKVKLLQEIDAYARAKDPRVRKVSASLSARKRRLPVSASQRTMPAPKTSKRRSIGSARRYSGGM